jgi:hypothetical protein
MAGECIIKYNREYKTWDVILMHNGREKDMWEVQEVGCDRRHIEKITKLEPKGDS